MNEHELETIEEEKDLGVIIDNKLKFHTHISAAIKKANRILGLIKRSFTELDENTLPILYCSMVRPHLENGNIILGRHYIEDMKAIERVQKRATRFVRNIKELSYSKRLESLKLPSLAYRRKRGDMIMVYKIMTGKININSEDLFTSNERESRGHSLKIAKNKRASKNPRCQAFSVRTINDWNSLPSKVVRAKTTNEFKSLLDEHWISKKYESLFM